MISEDRIATNTPAQIVYYDNYPSLHLNLLDTIEAYSIDQVTEFSGSTLIRVSSEDCTGYLRINLSVDRKGDPSGTVWFYKYCNHKFTERKFVIDPKRCFKLVEKRRKKNKDPGSR